jgi:hypothetical protein
LSEVWLLNFLRSCLFNYRYFKWRSLFVMIATDSRPKRQVSSLWRVDVRTGGPGWDEIQGCRSDPISHLNVYDECLRYALPVIYICIYICTYIIYMPLTQQFTHLPSGNQTWLPGYFPI